MKSVKLGKVGLLLSLLMIVGISMYFVSCSKTAEFEGVKTDEAEQKEYFKTVGDLHNKGLDYIAENCEISKTSGKECFIIADGFMNYDKSLNKSSMTWKEANDFAVLIKNVFENPENALSVFFPEKDGEDLDPAFDYLNDIASAFEKIEKDFDKDSIVISTDEFNKVFESIENDIYKNHEVIVDTETGEANVAAGMLATCAIAKNSYSYWSEAVSNPDNEWHNEFVSVEKFSIGSFFRIILGVVKQDAVGILRGFKIIGQGTYNPATGKFDNRTAPRGEINFWTAFKMSAQAAKSPATRFEPNK